MRASTVLAVVVVLAQQSLHCADAFAIGSIRPRPTAPIHMSIESDGSARSKSKSIDSQMLEIGLPALAGLAIDPLASAVDTAMIGRYCTAADLAGAGIATGSYNLVARCFNFLSPAVTSQVAVLSSEMESGEFNLDMARNSAAALAVACVAGSALALALLTGRRPGWHY